MKRQIRHLRQGAVIIVPLLILAACGGSEDSTGTGIDTDTSPSPKSDTVIIAIPGTPQGIDVDLQAGPQTWTIGGQVWELGAEWERTEYPFDAVTADPRQVQGFTYPAFNGVSGGPKFDGNIIENCELSEDGLEATYFLRKGVKSAWGNEFTADDVLFKVERAMGLGAIGAFLHNAANANDVSSWTKVDDYTVKISGSSPMPIICSINANMYWYFLDSKEVKKYVTPEDPWATKWVGLNGGSFGPYYITKWEAGKEVVLAANPNYWRGVPEIKNIIFQVVPESSSRLALLQSGDVDMAEGLTTDEVVSLDGSTAVGVGVQGTLAIFAVMNNAKAPFDDVNVRRAINTAIPRDEVVDFVYKGLANRWQGVIPSAAPGYIEHSAYAFNIDEAKEYLASSNYPNGFETTLTFNSGDPLQESVSIAMQSALAGLNIKLTLKGLPPGAYSDYVQSKDADFALWLDFPIEPDPNYGLTLFYETGMAVNYQNYSSAEVDRLLKEGRGVVDLQERLAFHEEIQRIVHSDASLAWITEPYFVMGVSSDLQGWGWYTTQYYRVSEMSRK